jgi:DNA-binding XRE family transcriptional regulator
MSESAMIQPRLGSWLGRAERCSVPFGRLNPLYRTGGFRESERNSDVYGDVNGSQGMRARLVLGGNIRRLREEAGLSLRGLAELVDIPHGRLSEYERGHYACTVDTIERLADALDVSLNELFAESARN